MAITQYYVDPAIAGDSGTGTSGDPWGDLQYALNTITRDATNGDQINVKAGTAEVLAAALTLATYGTPGYAAPLVFRGYTSAANDGGRGGIDCNGYYMFATTGYDYVHLVDLDITNTIASSNPACSVTLQNYCSVVGCSIIVPGASYGALRLNDYGHVLRVAAWSADHDGWGDRFRGIVVNDFSIIDSCFVWSWLGIVANNLGTVKNCIVRVSDAEAWGYGISLTGASRSGAAINNICYADVAAVARGVTAEYGRAASIYNNIIVGFSGGSAAGVLLGAGRGAAVGNNAFYNNTTNVDGSGSLYLPIGTDVSLAANPFTDANNNDFSLTAAAKTALAAAGWPASYLSAHANTVPNLNIGPIQMASSIFRRVARLVGG